MDIIWLLVIGHRLFSAFVKWLWGYFSGIQFDKIETLLCGLVETLSDPFSFSGTPSLDLGICPGLAMGLQRTLRTLCVFDYSGHSHYVDDLLSG